MGVSCFVREFIIVIPLITKNLYILLDLLSVDFIFIYFSCSKAAILHLPPKRK